jgi:hypothetical protein
MKCKPNESPRNKIESTKSVCTEYTDLVSFKIYAKLDFQETKEV